MPSFQDTPQQLKAITDKRLALENLIDITISIQAQQESLQDLADASIHSGKIPKSLLLHIKLLSRKMESLSVPEMIQRLEALEKTTSNSLNKLLKLVAVDVDELRDNKIPNLTVEDFVDSISNFKRRTKTSVSLRYLLQNRGVAIAPFNLDVSQESLKEHITQLKKKEKKCTKKIRHEINVIIKDTDVMIASEDLTQSMTDDLVLIKKAMQINLEHLDKGGKIKDIPHAFETVILESESTSSALDKAEEIKAHISENEKMEDNNGKEEINKGQMTQPKQESFWQIFTKWLSSPWNVSWKKLRNDSSKSSRK